jgi:uncharacterized protein YecE (DUF72 family)
MMAGSIRVGASGFSYKEWLGVFYPAKLPGPQMLAYYAERLPTVEINYTFRQMPRREMLERWASQTPASFRFALKAPQRITHDARLRGVEESVERFAAAAAGLGERLGPVLFQLPPDFARDLELLHDFMEMLNGRLRAAFEFRNRSWFHDSVLQTLRDCGAALCIAESERLISPVARTASYVYVRLRKEDYGDEALSEWARRLRGFAEEAEEIYVYFKHEVAAPEIARRLSQLIDAGTYPR